ncbi:MAG: PAS domain S-box protein [Candidatus Neomarinimicrobiota bacterium]
MSAQIDFLWVLFGTVVIAATVITLAIHMVISSRRELAERRQAEEVLRESEEKYRAVVEHSHNGVIIVDNAYHIVFANDQLFQILGYSREEILGHDFRDFLDGESKALVSERYHQRQLGEPVPSRYEVGIIRKDAKKRRLELSVAIIQNSVGQIKTVAQVLDITDRKRAEMALQESEERYRLLVELSPDVILVHKNGEIIFINPAGVTLMGADSPDQLIGRKVEEFIHPDSLESVKKRIEQVEAGHTVPFMEQKLIRLDGTIIDVETSLAPFIYHCEPAIQVVARDITERKKTEQEVKQSHEQLRNLSVYLQSVREEERGGIAREIHDELGQELTALKMDLSWLSSKLQPDQKPLQQKANAMTELTNSMIQTVKRISSELRPAVLDDLGVIAALDWEIAEFFKHTGIRCALKVEPDEFDLDPDRSTAVYRIFQEALTNIARHSRATAVEAILKVSPDRLELEIKDNGIGITEEQIHSPDSFGLIGIRERAMQFGGEARIEGITGEGTSISVALLLDDEGNHHD